MRPYTSHQRVKVGFGGLESSCLYTMRISNASAKIAYEKYLVAAFDRALILADHMHKRDASQTFNASELRAAHATRHVAWVTSLYSRLVQTLRRRAAANPAKPRPSSARLAGSGTTLE